MCFRGFTLVGLIRTIGLCLQFGAPKVKCRLSKRSVSRRTLCRLFFSQTDIDRAAAPKVMRIHSLSEGRKLIAIDLAVNKVTVIWAAGFWLSI